MENGNFSMFVICLKTLFFCSRSLTEDVEYRVGMAMNEEIRRVSVLVDDFNDPFHPEPMVVNVFKRRLNQHIEVGIGSNLRSRLSTELQLNVESFEQVIIFWKTIVTKAHSSWIKRLGNDWKDNSFASTWEATIVQKHRAKKGQLWCAVSLTYRKLVHRLSGILKNFLPIFSHILFI